MKFELEIDRRNVTDETLLSDITTLVEKIGVRVPTIAQYNNIGKSNLDLDIAERHQIASEAQRV